MLCLDNDAPNPHVQINQFTIQLTNTPDNEITVAYDVMGEHNQIVSSCCITSIDPVFELTCMCWRREGHQNKEQRGLRDVCVHFHMLCNWSTEGSMTYRSEPRDTRFPIAVSGALLVYYTGTQHFAAHVKEGRTARWGLDLMQKASPADNSLPNNAKSKQITADQ